MQIKNIAFALVAITTLVSGCGAPTPAQVCDHMIELLKKEPDSTLPEEAIAEVKKECTAELEKEFAADKAKATKEAKCVMAAKTAADIEKCGEKE